LPSHLPLEEPAVLGKGKSIRSFHLCLFFQNVYYISMVFKSY
jgi:hypothetical protein